jgi:hypothetical protein
LLLLNIHTHIQGQPQQSLELLTTDVTVPLLADLIQHLTQHTIVTDTVALLEGSTQHLRVAHISSEQALLEITGTVNPKITGASSGCLVALSYLR